MTRASRFRRLGPPQDRNDELGNHRLGKGVARYHRLYELLSVALQDGTIAPDSTLPSEYDLCARHGLSRTTVRRALDRLEREGRVVRRRGSGTYARSRPSTPRLFLELNALSKTLAQLESRTTGTTLRFTPAQVPAALRARAPELGLTAYLLERVRCTGGEPVWTTTAYFPEPLGRHLKPPLPSRASVMTMLDRLGPPTARISCSLAAVPADAGAARALRVPMGSPLLRLRSVLTDGAGHLRAVLETLCRSDRLQLRLIEPQRS